ncbi:MAG: magnesium/cobalt transporter CorA [Bacteroidota bacterium]
MPPGSIVFVGDKKIENARMRFYRITEEKIEEKVFEKVRNLPAVSEKGVLKWFNFEGLHQIEFIEKLGEQLGLDPLLLEDVVNTEHRPKIEIFEDKLFVLMKILNYNTEKNMIEEEQFSMLVGDGYVISFNESGSEIFDPVRDRFRLKRLRFMNIGAPYLGYALIDTIVDNYFVELDKIRDRIDDLEVRLTANIEQSKFEDINLIKRDLIHLHHYITPVRDIVSQYMKNNLPMIGDDIQPFLKDLYDHVIQITDNAETVRELAASTMELYHTIQSTRMNEVMKVLTIIATIFIPLTFVAGVYGMNFEYMPELKWEWGYPASLIVMAIIAGGMVVYFKRKNWF